MKVRLPLVLISSLLFAGLAHAQKIELAVLGGGHVPISPSINVSTGFAVQGNVAGRIFGVPLAAIYLELPVIGTFGLDAGTACVSTAVCKYSSLFVTPGLKLKLLSEFPVSPYFVAGGGVVRFKTNQANGVEDTHTESVFDFGGGTDIKVFPFVSLRGEIRDMYAGRPRLSLAAIAGRQHNLLVSGGLVLRF